MPEFVVLSPPYDFDLPTFTQGSYAVRSSYSLEDGSDYSYAGQFDSLLNVPHNELKSAIDKVSKGATKALEYQKANNISSGVVTEGRMDIIIQKMINSDYSGVLFTANPQGILNEMVLVVGKGTGNLVVEDKTDVTSYYHNKDDESYYLEQSGNSPKIPPEMVEEIFAVGRKIEQLFGDYVDIEFTIENDILYILQGRKITTLKNDTKTILDSSNISESYPGITLPTSQCFAISVYHHAFSSVVSLLSGSEELSKTFDIVLSNMVSPANGRMYYRISNWYHLLKILPFSNKIIPIWQEMLGVYQKDVETTSYPIPNLFTKSKIALRFMGYMITTPKKMSQLSVYFDSVYKESKNKIANCSDSSDLLLLYHELIDNIGSRWGITLINDMYAFIYTALAKKKYSEQLNNISQLESLKPIKALDNLYETSINHGVSSEEYLQGKKDYLALYGDRWLEELKLESPTLNTNPELLEQYLMDYTPTTIEVSSKSVNSLFLNCAKKGIYNRELSRMNRTRLYGLAREIIIKIGKNLHNQQKISCPADVFWLHIDEIKRAIAGDYDVKTLITSRKISYKEYENLPAYTRLVYLGEPFNKQLTTVEKSQTTANTSQLTGTASSKGMVTGEVLVVKNPNDCLDTTDKILVTEITDPGWVFLIRKAKGIIAQRGSILSHTAIITRELGKPSVVGVKNATTILKTGDIVRLDGTKGTITII